MSLSIREYLEQGPATSKEIQAGTGLSQGVVSRQLRRMANSVIKYQNGRTPKYAITRNAFGGDDKLPLFMVDVHGKSVSVAIIRPLAHGGFFVEALAGMPPLLLGEKRNGLYDDLPYFLDDLRPQGFLGRQIAEEMASQSGDFPSDPRNWNANHVGRYLISNGDDLPGNFKFGQQAHLRVRHRPFINIRNDYPLYANHVMNGVLPGSSAGGEQPKFTAYCGERSAHVIVKFSPLGDDAVVRRWRDILISEYHAIETIHSFGFPAAETKLIEMGGRLFLESQRFDRTGEYGRMSMISLQSVDAEFVGSGGDWPQIMDFLERKKMLSGQHVYDAEFLWSFGRLINNTDMHLGNLSLAIEGDIFRLLPVYDMCSMGFAPRAGEVLPYSFVAPEQKSINLNKNALLEVKKMAHDFWARVAGDGRISDEFKAFLAHGNPINLM